MHYLVKCVFDDINQVIETEVVEYYHDLPNIHFSINTKNGNNNIDDLMSQYNEILKFISSNYRNEQSIHVYLDAITNKWLTIPYGDDVVNSSFIIDFKENEKYEVDIPYSYLEKNTVRFDSIIFFNNSIYYPVDNKICSINLSNDNYVEFVCDNVSSYSTIEIIKKGFRIYNVHEVYDLVKETDDVSDEQT